MPAVKQWTYPEVEQGYCKKSEIILAVGLGLGYLRPVAAKAFSCRLEKRMKTSKSFTQESIILSQRYNCYSCDYFDIKLPRSFSLRIIGFPSSTNLKEMQI